MSASETARATGERVEVTSARSGTRQVFAEPDGSYTMELSTQPVRVRNDGGWVTPDATLERRSDGTIGPVAAEKSIAFSGGGSGMPLVRLADGTKWIELTWPEALPTPVLRGDTATYPDVLPDVDLRVRATTQGFSKVLVVKTPAAAKDPRLARIGLGITTDGLTVAANDYGGLSAKDATGEVVFESSKVEMWDSSGRHRALGRLELAAGQLAVIPDQKLLADPDATYPIMIDPDFHPPGAGWTKVFSGHPNNSYWNGGGGDDGLAKVGYCGWAGCNGIGVTRSFFQYDISALRGAQILGAEFNMHEVYAPSCSPRVFQVYQVGPIGGGTTWNNQPGGWWGPLGSPNVAYGYNSSCGPNWVGVAAGQSVINRLNDGSNVATFMLKAADEGDKFAWKKFDAGSLIVHYNWPPNHPSNLWANAGQGPSLGCASARDVAFTSSTRPTLRATLSDRDGQNLEAQFEWWHWGGPAPVGSTRTAFQPNGTAHGVTIPQGAFGDGAAISWRVRAGDGHIWGPWSGWCQITVDKTPPGRPTVTSADYPEDQVAGYVGKTGAFTVRSADTDVIGFQWSLNFQDLPVVDVNSPYFVRAGNGVATIRATPPREGRNDLYVRAVDRAHNVSSVYQKPDGNGGWVPGGYGFTVGSAVPRPVGHWPLDGFHRNTGAPDASGSGRHGTVTGIHPASGAAWTTGRVGDALRFSGNSDGYVTTTGPAVSTSGTFTVSAWARLDRIGGHPAMVSQDGNRTAGFQLQATPAGTWAFAMSSEDVDGGGARHDRIASAEAIQLGVWTHVVGVFDSGASQLRLYVNGRLAASGTHPNAWAANGPLTIGRSKWRGNPVDFWPGTIDDVKVWDRMLADAEIHQLANTPTIEETFYPLDEGTGTRTADVSGNYRTGTLTGGAAWLPGVVGEGAVGFDGIDDAITTTQQAVLTDRSFTVTARARLDTANGKFQTVVSQDGPNSSGFALQYSPTQGKWVMAVSPADAANPAWQTVYSAAPAQAGEWVNLAGVYDAAKREVRLYVNGTEHIAPAQVNAPVAGNVMIGRAKQSGAGGLVAYFGGRIDDVHLYTGVRTKEEIIADSLTPVTARPTVYSGQLSRFVGHDSRHFVTTGPVPPGQRFEWSLGLLAPAGAADTRMLYSCQYGGGQFVSLQVDCEGHTLLSEIGLVYRNAPAGIPSQAIYRCLVVATGDHFNSPHADCEGHRTEGLQGYTQAYQYLVRYAKQYPPHDHLTTSRTVPSGYRAEGVQGIVAMSGAEGLVGLMACVDGTDEFVSTDPDCGGKTARWWIGAAWQEPPAHAQGSLPLYACRTSPTGEQFTSLDEFCEGRVVIGPLGYVVTSF